MSSNNKYLSSGTPENSVLMIVTFKAFQWENQQAMQVTITHLTKTLIHNRFGGHETPTQIEKPRRWLTCEAHLVINRWATTIREDDFGDEEVNDILLEHSGGWPNPDYRHKVNLPIFKRQLHIKHFLDWIVEIERFFEYMKILEEKKVKLVAYELKGGASAGWTLTHV